MDILVKPFCFFDTRQTSEFSMKPMIGRNKQFLAMQNRDVAMISIIPGSYAKCLKMHCERERQSRMRVALKFGITQIGDLGLVTIELDDIRILDPSDVSLSATLEESENGREGSQRAFMKIESGW